MCLLPGAEDDVKFIRTTWNECKSQFLQGNVGILLQEDGRRNAGLEKNRVNSFLLHLASLLSEFLENCFQKGVGGRSQGMLSLN